MGIQLDPETGDFTVTPGGFTSRVWSEDGTVETVRSTVGPLDDLAVVRDMPDPRDDALDQIRDAYRDMMESEDDDVSAFFEVVTSALAGTGRKVWS